MRVEPSRRLNAEELMFLSCGVGEDSQRDGMGREEGGGCRMGNTCIPVADSF